MNKCVMVKDIKNALIELSMSGKKLERETTTNIIKAICNLQMFDMSEDCVSREYLEELCLRTLIPKVIVNTNVELGINIGIEKIHRGIKNAPPSVVPKRAEGGNIEK